MVLKRVFIYFLLCIILLVSCNKKAGDISIDKTEKLQEDIVIESSVTIEEDNKKNTTLGILPTLILVNNKLYNGLEYYNEYDITNLKYLGEITKSYLMNQYPTENYTSNCYPVGAKIYEINEQNCLLEYEGSLDGRYKSIIYCIAKLYEPHYPIRAIKIENNVYLFDVTKNSILYEYDLSNAEYIGDINEKITSGYMTIDNYTSNFCEKGSKVYRIDETTIVVEYEKDNKVFYEEGKIY